MARAARQIPDTISEPLDRLDKRTRGGRLYAETVARLTAEYAEKDPVSFVATIKIKCAAALCVALEAKLAEVAAGSEDFDDVALSDLRERTMTALREAAPPDGVNFSLSGL